jgi:hypothetical protein
MVHVRTDGGTYSGTPEELSTDYEIAVPPLPADITERLYEPGVRHALLAGESVVDGGPLPWTQGDVLIANAGAAIAAKAAREALAQQRAMRTPVQGSCITKLISDLAAVAPVTELRMPDVSDKSTWQIVYSQEPTQAQRDAAQAILAAFDLAVEVATLMQQAEAVRTRLTTFTSDSGVVDLLNRAKSASIAEIDNWLANNMTTLAQARAITAAEIKLLVIIATRLGLI